MVEIMMEEERKTGSRRCPAYMDMGNGRCTLRFKCDLEEGHDGKHFSMAEPPRKVASITWPNPQSKYDNAMDAEDWEQALVRIRKIVSQGFYSEILTDIRDALEEAGF